MSHTEQEGEIEGSVFKRRSDIDVSRVDKWKYTIDLNLIAPFRVIWSDWRARIGLLIILGYLVMGTIGVSVLNDPKVFEGPRYLPPFTDPNLILGTDISGKGIFKQIVFATPDMLKMITGGAVFGVVLGTAIGTLAGYKGGLADRLLSTFVDITIAIPGLPLVMVIAIVLEPRSPWIVGMILAINAWAGLARVIRSQVLTLRDEAYVEAARVMGAPTHDILGNDIIPNLMPFIMINFVSAARNVIFNSVALYFLAVLPFTTFNWGVMMNLAYRSNALSDLSKFHWLFFPMATILILSFGLIMFAQGTDRLFNPRVRARHAKSLSDDDEADTERHGGAAGRSTI